MYCTFHIVLTGLSLKMKELEMYCAFVFRATMRDRLSENKIASDSVELKRSTEQFPRDYRIAWTVNFPNYTRLRSPVAFNRKIWNGFGVWFHFRVLINHHVESPFRHFFSPTQDVGTNKRK